MTLEGVDYTTPEYPGVAALRAAGKKFACRYGGPGGEWKHITLAEAEQLSSAGIALVANAEGTEDGLLGGYAVGRDWAEQALADFTAIGMPAGRPIYLSADFDTSKLSAAQWDKLDEAMNGAASVLTRPLVGVYGGYATIAHFVANGRARWYWQAYAWSGGRVHPSIHIYQYRNKASVGGKLVDLDRSLTTDFGQWMVGEDVALTDDDVKKIWNYPDAKALTKREETIILNKDVNPVGASLQPEENQLKKVLDGITTGVTAVTEQVKPLAEQVKLLAEQVKLLTNAFEAAGATPGDYEVTGDLHVVKKGDV